MVNAVCRCLANVAEAPADLGVVGGLQDKFISKTHPRYAASSPSVG